MLKAYDYIEYLPDSNELQNPGYFEKELEIARGIVKRIHKEDHVKPSCCPVCKEKSISLFCKKWEISYFRCEACESVFAAASVEEVKQYAEAKELTEFRVSKEYQEEASQRRELTWTESIDWIAFRTFRYLGKNTGLDVLDIGNRYEIYAKEIAESEFAGNYQLTDSILDEERLSTGKVDKADIVLYLNQIQQTLQPLQTLQQITAKMKKGALLFFSTRMGTGFDVLTLRENSKIFPYEHIFLPSADGMESLLEEAGLRILEYSTPGRMDVGTVVGQADKLDEGNYFVKSLIKNCDKATLAEFQRFLQKSGMSSYVQIVAVKE